MIRFFKVAAPGGGPGSNMPGAPGSRRHGQSPSAPKAITSSDLLSFSMRMNHRSDVIHGSVAISLNAFDENDQRLLAKIGDRAQQFQAAGYVLRVSASDEWADRPGHHVEAVLPADESFKASFTQQILQSNIIALNGYHDWAEGLPYGVGEFVLSVDFANGEYLDTLINGTVPAQAIELYRALRPLLIDALIAAGENYLPLLNLDRGAPTPIDLIETISLRQSHMTLFRTYSFGLINATRGSLLDGNFADSTGSYFCRYVTIESADAERLNRALAQARCFFATAADIGSRDNAMSGVCDATTGSFSVSLRGLAHSFQPLYGAWDETSEDLEYVFRDLVKKYSN